MKVLVCGGRDYKNVHRVNGVLSVLHELHPFTCLVHGASEGADLFAQAWALARQLKYIGIPAEWLKHDKAAGPIRNQKMFDDEAPDIVVAFPGNKGTANMMEIARAGGLQQRYKAAYDGTTVLYRDTVPEYRREKS